MGIFSPLLYQLSYPASRLFAITYERSAITELTPCQWLRCFYGMKNDATASNSTVRIGASRQHSPAQYAKVFDQRKRRVRGLWQRAGA
jgi:hypothetical protein